jgi:hypothetical protein
MRNFRIWFAVLFLGALRLAGQGGITQPSAGFANPMTGADQLIGSGSSTSGTPSAISLLNCTTALTYSTTSHTFGCNAATAGVSSITGDGTIITNSASTGAVTLTIAGTSGGVPCFSSTTAWKSSALLTTNVLSKGGGAGNCPSNSSITDNGTTVTTPESILVSGSTSQIGLNQSGGTLLTMPSNTSIYSFGSTSRFTSGAIAGSAFFTAVRWDGTVGTPTAVQAGDQIGGFNSFAFNGTALNGPNGTFRCFANENQGTSNGGTYCEVGTTTNGTTTEVGRIRFEADGGVTLPNTVTGGDQGVGTLNATGLYQNGVKVVGGSAGLVTNNAVTCGNGAGNVADCTSSATIPGLKVTNNGALSTSPALMTGTWFSGGSSTTTKPQFLIECNSGTTTSTGWSANGTGLGVNACTGFTGNLFDAQLNGVSVAGNNPDSIIASHNNSWVALAIKGYPFGGTNTGDLLQFFNTTSVVSKFDISGNLYVTAQASVTGQRFACMTTTGELVSSATACVGT